MSSVKRHWPLVVVVALFGLIVVYFLALTLHRQDGHFVYALDDPYIHMAIAKNLALHGVWGVTPYEFTSASSSPLWVVLLALIYKVVGVHAIASFVLNVLSAVWLIAMAYVLFRHFKLPSGVIIIGLLVMILIMPLPWLVFVGHEHILHAAMTLTFVYMAALLMQRGGSPTRAEGVTLALLAAALPVTRYEAVFLIVPVVGLFLLRRQWQAAALIAFAASMPVLLFGGYFVSQGGHWVPSSLLVKSPRPGVTASNQLTSLVQDFGHRVLFEHTYFSGFFGATPLPVTILLALSGIATVTRKAASRDRWDPAQTIIVAMLFAGVVNLWMVEGEPQLRYYAYLVALAWCMLVVTLWPGVARVLPHRALSSDTLVWSMAVGLLAIVLGLGVAMRAQRGLRWLPKATLSIYRQQVQMATFVHTYYDDSRVMLNDIGAVTFETRIHLLDVAGLGTPTVADVRADRTWTSAFMDQLADEQGTQIAIIYDAWYVDVPTLWVRVGTWTIPHGGTVAEDTVTFYAIQQVEECALIEHLQRYSAQLPEAVVEAGLYTDRAKTGRLCRR